MFALVPAMGALLQSLVVPFLVLLNETLQTDVSADLEPQMVALQEQKEPRNTSVSISEWVYAKKIQVKGRQDHRGRDFALLDGVVVELRQLLHADRRICNANRLEANPRATIREFFNYVAVFLFVFPGIPDLSACQVVQSQNGLLRDREFRTLLMDQRQGLPVSSDFLFIPIAQ